MKKGSSGEVSLKGDARKGFPLHRCYKSLSKVQTPVNTNPENLLSCLQALFFFPRCQPNFVFSVTGIRASGIRPKGVAFLRRGNSIDADGTLGGNVLNKKRRIAKVASDLLKEGLRRLSRRDHTAVVGSYKLPPIAFLKLDIDCVLIVLYSPHTYYTVNG